MTIVKMKKDNKNLEQFIKFLNKNSRIIHKGKITNKKKED